MRLNPPRQITFNELEELLKTINPNVVKEINIELSSSCSSDMPFWAKIKVNYRTYEVLLGDMDSRYWEDGITYFFDIIRNSKVPYTCNEYRQQTCEGYKIWKV